MTTDGFDDGGADGPRVAPDTPKGSGERAARVVAALTLAVAFFVVLAIVAVVLLWLL